MFRAISYCLFIAGALLAQPAGQWTSRRDPSGFTIPLPPGWTVAGDQHSGRIEAAGPQQQQIVIWPVFVPGGALDARSAPAVLSRMLPVAGVRASWGPVQPAGAAAVRALGSAGGRAAVSVFTWANSSKGAAGYIFILSAPQSVYRENEDSFARILTGFRLTGAPERTAAGPAKATAAAIRYTRWTDPREQAFSLDVPAGWRITGGLFRFGSVDVRQAFEAVSPDGQIRISGGDSDIPTFTEPTQILAMSGLREGSWYSPGYGTRMFIRRYLPGSAFAREYVTNKAARGCINLEITENKERPDTTQSINSTYAQYAVAGFATRATAGEVAFTCRKDGQSMAGYYFATTQRTQMAEMGGLWTVSYLVGFLAPHEKAQLAQAIGEHMIGTLQTSTAWQQMQQNVTMNTSRIVAETNREVSNTISSSYWGRQKTYDEISRRRENAILGTVDVTDPDTGRPIKVENSGNYYWMDNQDRIVGTATYTRPNLDFRPLVQLP